MNLRALMLVFGLFTSGTMAAEDITAEDLLAQQAQGEPVVILDVRTPEEFAEGHVPGAINISHTQVAERLSELKAYKGKPVVVYCRSGRRAGMALQVLEKNGFQHLYHLAGDMNGWLADKRPVEK